MTTKKVKKTGKYGVRGGVGIRKKFLLATQDKAQKVCPNCGTKDKIKRVATGIYKCTKCEVKIGGGAYKFKQSK
ncbi:MAG: 50S ribosomal protein L37ae [Candidatus ainarchaeum sp.]|nr:50S ribosomal protein L37ae [Candidatus ainarchaeum sp.]